jgi:hypothetical protein
MVKTSPKGVMPLLAREHHRATKNLFERTSLQMDLVGGRGILIISSLNKPVVSGQSYSAIEAENAALRGSVWISCSKLKHCWV